MFGERWDERTIEGEKERVLKLMVGIDIFKWGTK
jgi:hypothetical protein